MNQYRCTRKLLYQHDCDGQYNSAERQGYYITAANEDEAWEKMAEQFPEEIDAGFTIDLWQCFEVELVEP
jgi:uncharacterized protein YcgL (UPF0745 family)